MRAPGLTRLGRRIPKIVRALFPRKVRKAEAEYRTGATAAYEDVESLLADLRR